VTSIKGSLVIPSLNRAEFLLDTVQSFLELGHPQWEILVVDQSDEKPQSLVELARAHEHLSYYHVTEKGLPNARNLGIEKAAGEIVAFVDDDVIPGAAFLTAHLEPYLDETVGGISGRIIDPSEHPRKFPKSNQIGKVRSIDGRLKRNFHAVAEVDVDHARGCNMSFRRELLREIGGFDIRYGGTSVFEDADTTAQIRQLGYRVRFCPHAVVTHLRLVSGGCRPRNLRNYFYWYGHNYHLYALKHLPRVWLPIFLTERVAKLLMTAVANRDREILAEGLRGLRMGYRSFKSGC
jgi:GT2 family glycosyltransferase